MTPKYPYRPARLGLRVALLLVLAGGLVVAFADVVSR